MKKKSTGKKGTPAANPVVGIIMGSQSDLKVMRDAAVVLEEFGVPFELTVVSAHRTPGRMVEYATNADRKSTRLNSSHRT